MGYYRAIGSTSYYGGGSLKVGLFCFDGRCEDHDRHLVGSLEFTDYNASSVYFFCLSKLRMGL